MLPSVLFPWAYWRREGNEGNSRVFLIQLASPHRYWAAQGLPCATSFLSMQLNPAGACRGMGTAEGCRQGCSRTREDTSPKKTRPSHQLPGASCQGCRDTLPGRTSPPGGSQQHRSPASPAGAQRQNGINSKALLPSWRSKESDSSATSFSA